MSACLCTSVLVPTLCANTFASLLLNFSIVVSVDAVWSRALGLTCYNKILLQHDSVLVHVVFVVEVWPVQGVIRPNVGYEEIPFSLKHERVHTLCFQCMPALLFAVHWGIN